MSSAGKQWQGRVNCGIDRGVLALVGNVIMMSGGVRVSERGVALIDVVFFLGVIALFLVLLFPRQRELNTPGHRVTIGAEEEATQL